MKHRNEADIVTRSMADVKRLERQARVDHARIAELEDINSILTLAVHECIELARLGENFVRLAEIVHILDAAYWAVYGCDVGVKEDAP